MYYKYLTMLLLSLMVFVGCSVDNEFDKTESSTTSTTEDNVVGFVRHYYLHGEQPATFIDKEIKVGVSVSNEDLASVKQAIYTSDCAYSNGLSLYYYTNYQPTLGYYICVHGVGTLNLNYTYFPAPYYNTSLCGTSGTGWYDMCMASYSVANHLRSLVNYNNESGAIRCTFYNPYGTSYTFFNYYDPRHRIYYSAETPAYLQNSTSLLCASYI